MLAGFLIVLFPRGSFGITNVVAWGLNTNGQTTVPVGLGNVVAVAAGNGNEGSHSLALRADSTVAAWGYNAWNQTAVPAGLSNVVAVAAGYEHSLALRANGTVAAWGVYNRIIGGIGNLEWDPPPSGLNDAVAVAAGDDYSLALRADGTIVAWGAGWCRDQKAVPMGLNNVVAVSAGGNHCLALCADGAVVAWGSQTTVPAGLSNVVAVAAGASHSLALRADGAVVAWGDNTYGQTAVPAGLSNVVAVVAGGSHSLALCANGTVVAWGLNTNGQTTVPAGLSNVVAVAAGYAHSLALIGVGKPYVAPIVTQITAPCGVPTFLRVQAIGMLPMCYQWLQDGQPLVGATNALLPLMPTYVDQSGDYRCIVSNAQGVATGGVVRFSEPSHGTLQFSSATNRIAENGGSLTLSVTRQGGSCWATIVNYATDDGSALAGSDYVSTNGTLTWSDGDTNAKTITVSIINDTINEGNESFAVTISDAMGVSLGSPASATVTIIDDDLPPSVNTPPQGGVAFLGQKWTFSVGASGSAPLSYQWQMNGQAIPGATSTNYILSPVQWGDAGSYRVVVSNRYGSVTSAPAQVRVVNVAVWDYNYGQGSVPDGLSNAVAVAAGDYHSLALRADGSIAVWGQYYYGDYNYVSAYVPAGLSNVVSVAAGANHSLALRADGTVAAWGYNAYGQTNMPAGLNNVVAVAAGGTSSLALRADGSVVTWGSQTNVPTGLSNVVAVAAGDYHCLALRANGTVAAWGRTNELQTLVPVGLSNVVAVAAGGYHSLALRVDGSVAAWGDNTYGQTAVPAGLSNVVAVVAGWSHSLALRADGTVITWGSQTTLPAGLHNAVAVATGGDYSLAVIDAGRRPFVASMVNQIKASFWIPVFLRAQSVGDWPLHYQWQKDGTPLAGATNALLTLMATNVIQSGDYRCTVSNAQGVTTGTVVHVAAVPVAINIPPQDGEVSCAQSWTFSVGGIFGVTPLSYQWQKDGQVIIGATSSTYVVSSAQLSDAGFYSVVVSNKYGSVTSASAQFRVANVAAWGFNGYGQTTVPVGLSNVVTVAAGYHHSLALRADGTVVAWGSLNNYGQITVPADLSNVVAVAAGDYHSLALRVDGSIMVWGASLYGLPTVPAGLSNVVAVAAGGYHNLALRASGSVAAWGDNSKGQTTVPAGLSNVVAVAAGAYHNLALRADGTVVAWGYNGTGQTSVPVWLSNVVAVAAGGDFSLALRSDGTVVVWGSYYNGSGYVPMYVPAGLYNVVAVAAGNDHGLALCADGTVVAWGYNGSGQSTVLAGLNNVVAVAAGVDYSLAAVNAGRRPFLAPMVSQVGAVFGTPVFLQARAVGEWPLRYQWQKDGTPFAGATNALLSLTVTDAGQTGDYRCIVSNTQGVTTGSLVHVTAVPLAINTPPQSGVAFLGQSWMFSVEIDGANPFRYQWYKDSQVINTATSITYTVSSVQSGDAGSYSVAVSNQYGRMVSSAAQLSVVNIAAWGTNEWQTAVPAGLSNVVSVAAGSHHGLALHADGTVAVWGSYYNGSGNVLAYVPAGLSNVVAMCAGDDHGLALRADGTVAAWGSYYNGSGNVPAYVPAGLSNVVAVSAGASHSLALRADGTVAVWGLNTYGQTNMPSGLSNAVAVAAGGYHSLALRADGAVAAWGYNKQGQTTVPASLSNVVAVSAGSHHSLALRADGTVAAWGYNAYGQTTVPAGLSNVVAVSAGGYHSLALRADGTVVVWGLNDDGQTVMPAGLSNVVAVSAGGYHSLALIGVGRPFLTPIVKQIKTGLGLPVFLRAQPTGKLPMNCRWQKDGVPLAGATNVLLTLTVTNFNQSGAYRCIVSNAQGVAVGGVVQVDAVYTTELATNNVPKWWLVQYGLTNFDADAMSDVDHDGMLTWQEWVAGCNPTNGDSVFEFTGAVPSSSQGIVIRWPSISNRFYNLSRATTLLSGTNVFIILPDASNMPATPIVNSYTDMVQGVGPYYYRIDVRE